MKCQNCGENMISGHLYCDACGAEYQIVPNFEPEIENSIAESLSDISDTIEESFSKKVTNYVFYSLRSQIFVPIGRYRLLSRYQ